MNKLLYNLKRILRTSTIGRSKLYLAIRYFVKRSQIDKFISIYEGEVTPERKKRIRKMMFEAMLNYRWDFDEFYIFGYEALTDEVRKSFVPEYDKNIFCDLINDPKQADIFMDKWNTYLHFKEYFGREVYNIRSIADIESEYLKSYIHKHQTFMLKPVFGALGNGIEIIKVKNYEETKKYLLDLFDSGMTSIILEELIEQDEKMASLHKESVNTLRIRTVRIGDRIEFIHPSIRMGQHGAFVDNAGAGGIIGNIDIKKGVVYSARDKVGVSYETHPDSKTRIIGFEIPKWQEALDMVRKMTNVLPNVHYVGWDIALSKNGWVMVEGNDKGQWGFQYIDHKGFRDEMNAILRELGKKELH